MTSPMSMAVGFLFGFFTSGVFLVVAHLTNRHWENHCRHLRAELENKARIVDSLAARCARQSELLANRAECKRCVGERRVGESLGESLGIVDEQEDDSDYEEEDGDDE